MPGWITNGLPPVGAAIQNGVTQVAPAGQYAQVDSHGLLPLDTELASGATPQTVSVPAFLIASIASALITNTATSTVHATTQNTLSGRSVTEALTTAAGSTYTYTLTNSNVTAAGAPVLVDIRSGTNTTPGMVPTSVTNAAGSVVFVFTNTGTAAINGTMIISWHV
jgi:hypothetical protein